MPKDNGQGYDAGPQLPNYMRKKTPQSLTGVIDTTKKTGSVPGDGAAQKSAASIERAMGKAAPTNKAQGTKGTSQKKTAPELKVAPKSGSSTGRASAAPSKQVAAKATAKKMTSQSKNTTSTKPAQQCSNASKATPQSKGTASNKPAQQRSSAQNGKQTSSNKRQPSAKSGNGGRSGSGKKKNGIRKGVRALVGVALVLVAVLIIVMVAGGDGEGGWLDIALNKNKTFANGVRVAGVDVAGMTPEEATGLVKYSAEKRLESVGIVLTLNGESWTLSASDMGMTYTLDSTFADALAYNPDKDSPTLDVVSGVAGEFDVEYEWNHEILLRALNRIAPDVKREPVEPYAEPIIDATSSERFNYVSGTDGVLLNVDATAEEIASHLKAGDFNAEITPLTNAILPTGDLESLKAVTQLRGSFETRYSDSRTDEAVQNRVFNIKKASELINGSVVQPGATWSFNTVVGPRTYELGWKAANGISGGKEYTLQAGGGICQASTTLYNALLYSNIEIVNRRAHSIPSSYVSKGLDATVDTRGIDFVFKNNTEAPLYVFSEIRQDESSSRRYWIKVSIYGEPLPAGVTYKSRSEIIETTERTPPIYTNDANIPTGYELLNVKRHDGFVAEAYLDKYVNGKLSESTLLHTDKYAGNVAEVKVGTGDESLPLPDGAVPLGQADITSD